MREFEPGQSRVATRSQKRKQNRLLNLLIAIVCILILVVGYNVFFGASEEAGQTSSEETGSGTGGNQSEVSVSGDSGQEETDDGTASAGEDADSATNEMTEQDASTKNDGPSAGLDQEQTNDEGGPEVMQGPWKPIGTQQEPPHVSSYERGSVDWNEKVKALLYATGISADNYILWRLENGGGPQQSVGKISTKENPHEWYIVHLQWVKHKGWKPTSVKKVYKENLPE